jgi:hypothetical protein
MEPDAVALDLAAIETTVRVAEIWRAQGEKFLENHSENVFADVDRLRGALVVQPVRGAVAAWQDRAVDVASAARAKLRSWDEETAARIRAGREELYAAARPGAVVDLTGSEPVVTKAAAPSVAAPPLTELGNCRRHPGFKAEGTCRRCTKAFCDECLVYPRGPRQPALCRTCALVVAGIRHRG